MSLYPTPAEMVFAPGPIQRLFDGISRSAALLGRWRRPRDTTGDYPEMTFVDKAHWIHKARHPVMLPERGRHPERFHLSPAATEDLLPAEFEPLKRVTVVVAGDLMPHPALSRSPNLYDGVREIFAGTDWWSANLESPVIDTPATERQSAGLRPPTLGFDRCQLEAVLGFPSTASRHVSLANNHILDHGRPGLEATLAALDELDVGTLGVSAAASDRATPVVHSVGGVPLGLVAFTFGLNGNEQLPEPAPQVDVANLNAHLDQVKLARLRRQVEACRRAGALLVIAHLHWGLEFELFPTRKQQQVARHLFELGVDLIVSHHPHVVQPIELYHPERDPGRVVPICYSLGNLISPYTAPIYRLSLLARVVVAQGWLEGEQRAFVESVTAHPVVLADDTPSGSIALRPLTEVGRPDDCQRVTAILDRVFGVDLVESWSRKKEE